MTKDSAATLKATKIDNPFLERVLGNLERFKDRPFCHFVERGGERVVLWGELDRRARQYAAVYHAAARSTGVVLIFLRHTPDLYASFLGAMLAGCTPSFMPCTSPRQDPDLYWASHATLLRVIAPTAIVADAETFAEMDAAGLSTDKCTRILPNGVAGAPADAIVVADASATCLLQHSSGTTGLKKGVALSYAAVARQLDSYIRALDFSEADRIVSWLPLYHDMGLMACFMLPLYSGAPLVHIDAFDWLARPAQLFALIEAHGGTLVWLPNFAFEHLANIVDPARQTFDLRSMRAFIDCSEPCRLHSLERFAAVFAGFGVQPRLLQCCYAMAETVFAVSQTPLGQDLRSVLVDPASLELGRHVRFCEAAAPNARVVLDMGPPLEGAKVEVRDPDGRPLPEGVVGEIAVSADFLFVGYNREPERTHERLRDGWYYTRDLGFAWRGGLFVLGRSDDVIIVNGKNLFAHDVEAVVSRIEGVKPGRAVALPVFDERNGSDTLVVIAEAAAAADEAAVRRTITSRVYAEIGVKPFDVRVVGKNWLVKTTSGKISRKENFAKYVLEFRSNA